MVGIDRGRLHDLTDRVHLGIESSSDSIRRALETGHMSAGHADTPETLALEILSAVIASKQSYIDGAGSALALLRLAHAVIDADVVEIVASVRDLSNGSSGTPDASTTAFGVLARALDIPDTFPFNTHHREDAVALVADIAIRLPRSAFRDAAIAVLQNAGHPSGRLTLERLKTGDGKLSVDAANAIVVGGYLTLIFQPTLI